MDNLIQVPLNLPDVCVLSTHRTEQGHWLIRVESTREGTQCRRCAQEIHDLHGLDTVVRLRHLPLFDVPVFLEIRPKRSRCPTSAGNPTTTQRCEWYEPRSPNTKAYEPWALRMLISSTVADAARKLGGSEETSDGLLDRWIERTVERACTDRYEGFVNAITEAIPWAEIVIDRFHVARAYRDCADTVRTQELKRLKRALPKAEYAQITGAMWPFRKRPGDLEPEQWDLLERLFTYAPKIEAAYHLREDLTDLFDRDYTKPGAKCAIRVWCKRVRQSGLTEFESFLRTIDRWLDEITHYFRGRQTSGFVEGFNNRVKVLTRRCYGLFNIGRLFQRRTLDWHGYQLFDHT